MADKKVLLIHGMGTHPLENMAGEFKAGLKEAAIGLGIENFNPDDHMDIIEFNYSETLDNIRGKLASDANEISAQFPQGHPSSALVGKLLKYQADISKDEMLYTHWLDVALYCLHYGVKVQAELATKLNDLFSTSGDGEVHVVAHSLGTALLHDTLHKFYKNTQGGGGDDRYPYLQSGLHNLKTLWTIANVSKLVAVLNDFSETGGNQVIVGENGCTDRHYNVYHFLDPFCLPKPYNEDTAPDPNTEHIETKVVRIKNTHSFQEYVAHPDVARKMLFLFANKTEGMQRNDQGEFERFENYVKQHKKGTPQGIAETIKEKLDELREGGEPPIHSIKNLLEYLEAFKEVVEGVWEHD